MLAAVVVTHLDRDDRLERCLASLERDDAVDAVVVVDNGAQVGVAAIAERHGARVLAVHNEGLGAAANAGIDAAIAAGAGRVLVLNDDVTVRAGSIGRLVEAFDTVDADVKLGAVQPKLVFADSGLINSLGVEIGADGAGVDIGIGAVDGGSETTGPPRSIDIFTGGAVLMSAEFVRDVGGFDERYFLYYEDVDLALRGSERGWVYRVVPDAVVEHVGGATTQRLGGRIRYLSERNRLWSAFRFADAATCGRAVWLSVRRLRHPPIAVHWKALAAGLVGCPGALFRRLRARGRAS